jgi:hypothetical protein
MHLIGLYITYHFTYSKTIEAPHNIVSGIHDPSTRVELQHTQPAVANPTWYINVRTRHLGLEVNTTTLTLPQHHGANPPPPRHDTINNAEEEPHITQQAEPQQSTVFPGPKDAPF